MAFTKINAAGIGTTETVTVDGLTVINDGSFGGNLSVGGTITYEDVTNVDSVGIITARAGVLVGSGITLSKDGDGFFTGVTTSTTFVGALTGNVTGNISGGTVAGSTGTFSDAVTIVKSSGPLLELTTNTSAADATLRLSEGATGSTSNGGGMFYSGADNKLHITCGTNSTTKRITINRDDGLVGIGSDAPTHNLDVHASGNTYLKLLRSGYNPVYVGNAAGEGVIETTGATFFKTGGSERVRIGTDGAVKIPDGGASTGRLSLGTDEDLKIYHSGSDAFVVNATFNLDLRSNSSITLYNSAGTEVMATFTADGSSELRHNNLHRLTTQSAGVDVRNETECFFKIARTNDSPSDGDYVGNLEFLGKDSGNNFTAYGKILSQIIDTTDGTEDGRVIFQSMKEGTMTTAATIEHGYFQNNTAPGYFGDNAAWTSAQPNMHNPSLKWTSGDYVSSTGVFTCPVAGKYLCSASVQAHRANNNTGGSSTYFNVLWQKNNSNYHIEMVGTVATDASALGVSDVNGKHATVTATAIIDCAKGDTIRAHSNHGYRNASQNIVGVILIA